MSKTVESFPRAVGYIRVSTAGQVTDGVSLEAQQDRIRQWCQLNGYSLIGIEKDAGLSGGRADNRPGLQSALTMACKHRAALVVYSLSRLARSTKDMLTLADRLEHAKADLVSLSEKIDTTSAAGKMLFRILSVLAEFERDLVSERTTAAMAHLRGQNRRISGAIPYGSILSEDGSTLIPVQGEQRVIEEMRGLQQAGQSLNGIARELNSRRVPSKSGGQWSAKTVRGVIIRTGAA
jgi:DNA invertase Pin-like site-specific DNA recombinase